VSHLSIIALVFYLIRKINEKKIERKINIDLAMVASQSGVL